MYMRLTIKTILLLTALSGVTVASVSAQVLTIDSVLMLIERNNPMLKEYESRARAYDTYAEGATSWMAPMVGAGTFMTPYPNQTLMEEGDKGMWMFSIEQEIPNPARLKAKKNYLKSKSDVEHRARSAQYNELRAAARNLYYQWLVAERKLSVLEENGKIIELMLKLSKIRYPYSQGSLGNIYKAEGRLAELENEALMTRADIEEKRYRLKSLMNLSASDSIMIDTTTSVGFELSLLTYDTALLAQQRSDVQRIDETIETMRLNQQFQRSQAKPDLKIKFDHMQPIGNMPSQFSAMAMISIPIAPWSSKMYKSEVKAMEYEIDAMQKGREAILIEARGMLAGMANQVSRMKQQLENYQTKIIPALRKNYQTVMLAYEENREQLPIVIDAWEALNMAQMEYLEKLGEYYTMIVTYEKQLEQ